MSFDVTNDESDDEPTVVVAPEVSPAPERITVDEFHRRATAGEGEYANLGGVELLEGVVAAKMRQSLRHEGCVEKLREVLQKLLPEGWHLRLMQPIVTADSQPEPDIAVVQGTIDGYVDRIPRPEDCALVVEIADTSLKLDRRQKGRVYAHGGVVCYWILNLIDSQLEVFTNPSGPVPMPGFHEQRVYRAEDKLSLVIGLTDLGSIRVADMIP
jgi:Uma2 family endonuclease